MVQVNIKRGYKDGVLLVCAARSGEAVVDGFVAREADLIGLDYCEADFQRQSHEFIAVPPSASGGRRRRQV